MAVPGTAGTSPQSAVPGTAGARPHSGQEPHKVAKSGQGWLRVARSAQAWLRGILRPIRSIFVTRNFVTRKCGLGQKSQFLIFLPHLRFLTRSTWVSGGVSGCLGVSGGVSAHRSLRIYGSPRRTIFLICPPECVFGPPEYGESMGPQQPPEYAGGPKNVPLLGGLRNFLG